MYKVISLTKNILIYL